MRLDLQERGALKFALKDFKGEVYLFGSRLDDAKNGGDIDLLLVPAQGVNPLRLSLRVKTRFFSKCEEKIDVIVYEDNLFCKEALKNAKRINIAGI